MPAALLKPTSIATHDDVHHAIDRVMDRAGDALVGRYGFAPIHAGMFTMIFAELCQNVIEHADAPGEVSIEAGNRGVIISVTDDGRGFTGSLGIPDDEEALRAALLEGRTRFTKDPGRGQGLKQVQRRLTAWGAALQVQAGSAQLTRRGELVEIRADLERAPGVRIRAEIPPQPPR